MKGVRLTCHHKDMGTLTLTHDFDKSLYMVLLPGQQFEFITMVKEFYSKLRYITWYDKPYKIERVELI